MGVHHARLTIIALTLFAFFVPAVLRAQTPDQLEHARQWEAYYAELREYQVKLRLYHQQMAAFMASRSANLAYAPGRALPWISLINGRAACASWLPLQVMYAVNAANHLQTSPYVLGAGHRHVEDFAYDCSSAVSYVLIKAGLLEKTLTSQQFAGFGEPGPGRFITLWVKPGHHIFMTLCGLRLDTSGGATAQGPRWRTKSRSLDGFIPRHPPGF